jgi:hypothetical protein
LKDIALTETALDAFIGIYEATGTTARVVTRAGKELRMSLVNTQDRTPAVLRAYAEDSFYQENTNLRFRFVKNARGDVTQMIRIDAGDEEKVFERKLGDASAPSTPAASK